MAIPGAGGDQIVRGGGDKGQLKIRAYDALKELLVSGSVAPGTFLSERQLSKQLGMSNTPVRTALGRLEAEGYITISPQQGIIVRELSVQEITDHYEFRAALESYVLRRLAGRLIPAQLARLRENLEQQSRSLETGDSKRTAELDVDFHVLFCDFLGNQQISRAMLQQLDKTYRAILSIARKDSSRKIASYREHSEIAEAMIAGDAERAVGALFDHLELGRAAILSPSGSSIRPAASSRRASATYGEGGDPS